MRKYIVNDREVGYLDVTEREDGALVVYFEEKFNLLTAKHSDIMERLRSEEIWGCQIINYEIQYKILIIKMGSIEQLTSILHTLEIPYGCYEVDYENAEIIIDTPDYHRLIEDIAVVGNEENMTDEATLNGGS